MTPQDFARQREHLFLLMQKATTKERRDVVMQHLQDLNSVEDDMKLPKIGFKSRNLSPIESLTPIERYDKKNARREAIMSQRARHGTGG